MIANVPEFPRSPIDTEHFITADLIEVRLNTKQNFSNRKVRR